MSTSLPATILLKSPFEDVIRADILPGCIVIRLASGVPADKVKLVVLGGQRLEKLKITHSSISVDPLRQETLLVVEADLVALLSWPFLRIQIWVEGYLVWNHNFPTRYRELIGSIEAVCDYCLSGWAANLFGEAVPPLEFLLDGVAIADAPITLMQHSVNRYVPPPACIGFRVPLPSRALDGAIHELRIRIGDHTTLSMSWHAEPRCQIESYDSDSVSLQFLDAATPDQPMTVSALLDGNVVYSASQTSFARRFSVPSAAILSTSGIELRAGSDAQLAFATLYPCTPAAVAFHRIANALLQVERALRLESGWGRDRLTELQSREELGRIVRPHLRVETNCPQGSVSVLVPIYKGVGDTTACLDSLANAVRTDAGGITEIILINDHSPDPAIIELLRNYPGRHMYRRMGIAVQVLHSHQNQGFVASVNAGFAAAMFGNDILLLNSDTVVPIGIVSRLRVAAYSRHDIASVTPLSNDATILSLPDRAGGNAIGTELAATLDAFLQEHGDKRIVDIPVGIGFCMLLKHAALVDVGNFGTEWGRGYCEEVDWCLRARDRGWTHVAAVDTFVHHRGSVSFGKDERTKILERNHALLERRYPDYVDALKAYMADDPLQTVRCDIFCLLLRQANRPCLVHFTHNMGGGTDKLVDTLVDRFAAAGGINLVCARVMDEWLGEPTYEVHWRERNLKLRLRPVAITELVLKLEKLSLPRITLIVHSLTGVGPDIYAVTEKTSLPYTVYVHDYQWYCPRVVLVDQTQEYCGEPTIQRCQLCVRDNTIFDFAEDSALIRSDLSHWISKNSTLLEHAQAVVVPSHDTATRIAAHFPRLVTRYMPHPESVEHCLISRETDAAHNTRIAIVGGISVQKGCEVIRKLAAHIDMVNAPMSIEVIGAVEDTVLFAGIASMKIGGSYRPHELPARLAQLDPHFVFFPAVWPETYSFVLSEIWAAGYPAVAFDVGAIAERIRATGAGVVLPFETSPQLLLPRLLNARSQVATLAGLEFSLNYTPEP
jgi:GT2 family glycosyltransferase/glycosyltransferase involved in cell wall biosynthesis